MKSYSVIFLVLAIIAAGCGNKKQEQKSDKLSGNISISGAFALYPMAQKWAEEFMKENPDVKIDISAGGAGKGMTDVLNGMVDMAMFSRSVSPEEENQGAWKIAVAKDVVLPTINAKNPVYAELKTRGLTKEEFQKIYITQEIKDWSQLKLKGGGAISLFSRSDACGAAEMWAKFMDGAQEDLKGVGVFGDPGIADAVKNDVKGVGFNNIIYAYDYKTGKIQDGIGIIPIDINGNGKVDPEEDLYSDMKLLTGAIRDGKFPEPPARPLYFICKGKPDNAIVLAFLNYILTTGQQWVEESGYVKLPEAMVETEKKKLD
ncbi:MAG: phosphate ABC transporter substrate-binding protein [Bacteroidetes bacterium GWF2_43_63]|nr:MAG: phosphate ABC transporter substrate-binding protein [Bacteroidetes bacterium GWE2_42_42]OFY56078.1 MAG: phosphate ABC transporter substrate-binding protein [Bacteroidetes bacterium GWF2_43_63]HBG70669.1 phosphate ABC transporter substrate-binding protein [Bacteroidales bacterium]HCB62503.1 phosphate ABC transporter substrate-binding protein [Bacteroidales bacterium]HCY21958.1 phosphate ABC transporter substrate-binding protein [Bacteroidales bacterium]